MSENNDRRELERRLEQVRRLSNLTNDALTKERLEELARDIEEQLMRDDPSLRKVPYVGRGPLTR